LQTAFAHGLQSAASAGPMSQGACMQEQLVWQSCFALSTQGCVQLAVQHPGIAPHTAVTQGSAPQSWAASTWQDVSHEALPQQAGCCAQTVSAQGSWHARALSAAPGSQTACGQVAPTGQGPQSAAHDVQSSPPLQVPLPQHGVPQALAASLTHWASHAVMQQYGSAPHTVAAQLLQVVSSGPPRSQVP